MVKELPILRLEGTNSNLIVPDKTFLFALIFSSSFIDSGFKIGVSGFDFLDSFLKVRFFLLK